MTNKPIWNDEIVHSSDVKIWIKTQFPNSKEVIGPIETFRANKWGITASFKVVFNNGSEKQCVCKIGFLPIFKTSPDIYGLLNKSCTNIVPKLLYSEIIENKTWMIFEPFEGENIKELDKYEYLLHIAETMASIQVQTNKEVPIYENKIPIIKPKDIPKIYKKLLVDIENKYLKIWIDESENLAKEFNLNHETLKEISDLSKLKNLEIKLEYISQELEKFQIPLSIDHIDLHSGNAVRQPDGSILVFDWEEATISCPLFSIDRLMDETTKFKVEKVDSVKLKYKIPWTKEELIIRDSYLENIPWINPENREYVFDLAMCLSPIKYAYQGMFFINQVGWEKDAPGLIAQSIIRAYNRCEYMVK